MLSRPLHHQTQTAAAASSSTRLQSATNCSSSSPQSHLAESDDVSDADVDDMSNSESEFDGNMDNDGMEKEEEGVAEKNGINECNESSNSQQEFEVWSKFNNKLLCLHICKCLLPSPFYYEPRSTYMYCTTIAYF